jgi:hypothetical protein
MSQNLNFDGTTRNIPQQNLDVGNRNVTTGPVIEIEEMGTLGVPSYAYKNLPILRMSNEYMSGDRAIEKPVVLNKGTIVAVLTTQTITDDGVDFGEISDSDNLQNPSASGTIPQYESVSDGSIIDVKADESYFGYDDSVTTLVVPANGNSSVTYAGSALDDEYAAWFASSDSITIGPNIPMGVVYTDVYADIRGASLNYELQGSVGIAAKGFMTVPFADINFVDANVATGGATMAAEGYDSVNKKGQFLVLDSSANEGISGVRLGSDTNGHFTVESTSPAFTPTVQTVGKLVAVDNRFPKESMDQIRTYPMGGLNIPNVRTAGIPAPLYTFVKNVMTAVDSAPEASDVLNAIKSGGFGYARIQFTL